MRLRSSSVSSAKILSYGVFHFALPPLLYIISCTYYYYTQINVFVKGFFKRFYTFLCIYFCVLFLCRVCTLSERSHRESPEGDAELRQGSELAIRVPQNLKKNKILKNTQKDVDIILCMWYNRVRNKGGN